jgi:hypothetical protein
MFAVIMNGIRGRSLALGNGKAPRAPPRQDSTVALDAFVRQP